MRKGTLAIMKQNSEEDSEFIVRVATKKNLGRFAFFLFITVVFLGSASTFESLSGAAQDSVGGLGAAIGPDVRDDVSDPNEEDRGLYYTAYTVASGDTVGDIADKYDISIDSIVSFNNIKNTRALHPGQILKVPNMAGILYTAKAGDTVDSVASSYDINQDSIIETNGLMSTELPAGKVVFLPDARLPSFKLREINGDLFRWPVRGYISSRYGWRNDPFTGSRSFHSGLDIASNMGVGVGAAMEGRVAETGYSSTFGNYIRIVHHSGYQTFYGHLSAIYVRAGQAVGMGQRIGAVGNSGYSTGPHLHFSIYKNGRLMNPAILLH